MSVAKWAALVAACLLAGFVLGVRFNSLKVDAAYARYEEAQTALDAARDTIRLSAEAVEITPPTPDADTVVQVVVRYRPSKPDTVTREIAIRDTIWNVDTVIVSADGLIKWKFSEKTPAYTITGQSVANLLNPRLSYTNYSLDVNEKAVCGKPYRFGVTLALVGGPYAGVSYQLKRRLSVGAAARLAGESSAAR